MRIVEQAEFHLVPEQVEHGILDNINDILLVYNI